MAEPRYLHPVDIAGVCDRLVDQLNDGDDEVLGVTIGTLRDGSGCVQATARTTTGLYRLTSPADDPEWSDWRGTRTTWQLRFIENDGNGRPFGRARTLPVDDR